MMGHTHAMTGAAAAAALLPVVPVDGPWGQLAFVACGAGMALLPDLDHEDSTASIMWGPISGVLARVMRFIGRGHRGGTHDFIAAPIAFAAAAWAASLHRWAAMVVVAIAVGLALRAWHWLIPGPYEKIWPVNLVASAGAGWWLVHTGTAANAQWLPLAVAVGVVVHIVGDALTAGGVPRPFSWLDGRPNRMRGGPLKTNGFVDRTLAIVALAACAVLLTVHVQPLYDTVTPVVQAGAAAVLDLWSTVT